MDTLEGAYPDQGYLKAKRQTRRPVALISLSRIGPRSRFNNSATGKGMDQCRTFVAGSRIYMSGCCGVIKCKKQFSILGPGVEYEDD